MRRLPKAILAAALCAAASCTRNPYDDPFWYWAPEPGSTLTPRVHEAAAQRAAARMAFGRRRMGPGV
ncbi:MAG: hypothetical protein ACKOEL_05630 [Planctomycetota bacterium]